MPEKATRCSCGSPVLTMMLNCNIIQDGADVAVQVDIPLKLVQKLTSHSVDIHHPPSASMFSDDTCPVKVNLRNREPWFDERVNWIPIKTREIGSCHVGRAFYKMTGNQGTSETIVISLRP